MGALKSDQCSKGHPMSGANLYERKDGSRECRQCSKDRSAKQSRAGKRVKAKPELKYDYTEQS